MTRRIYVASSWRNQFQQDIVVKLRAEGHSVYDFRGPGDGWGSGGEGPGGFAWSEVDSEWQSWPTDITRYLTGLQHPRAIEGFNRDMDALIAADTCLMVMPCGPSASMEMGWAKGSGRLTIVYIPAMREPDLMVGMADLVTADWDAVARALISREGSSIDQELAEKWRIKNGAPSLNLNWFARAQDEMDELKAAVESRDPDKIEEESSDVQICLKLGMAAIDRDSLVGIRHKQRVNDNREWSVTEDGCLKHNSRADGAQA